ncbi:MAG: helix-turn-helix domain-containing protein [Firmicutes bacterium]|nr:helix-turn-helix domain-containing protein [Bacillota bacterium]
MELGEKLRQARLEAGLSQRQLCGEIITRNMLSLIENGSAQPSMDTLKRLAARLDKPVSYFLEETAVTSPNQSIMAEGRRAYREGNYPQAIECLAAYQPPDLVFDEEHSLLLTLSRLALAEDALAKNQRPYARALLEAVRRDSAGAIYYTQELERRRLLLLAQVQPELGGEILRRLPGEDSELLLRARQALADAQPDTAAVFLDACRDRDSAQWCILRGDAALGRKAYAEAAGYFHRAEQREPESCYPRLEECYRAMEDYKQAYTYACKQRK